MNTDITKLKITKRKSKFQEKFNKKQQKSIKART